MKRKPWRRNTLGERYDSRHFDSGFEWSGFITEDSYPEPPSYWKHLIFWLLVIVALGLLFEIYL